MGSRNLSIWNQVLCLKFIWILLSSSTSLWAEWHRNMQLNDKSFWSIKPAQTNSWAWKRLLKIRHLAIQFCKSKIGNGMKTSFWYDVWTPLGQLITFIGPLGPRALRLDKDVVVSDAVNGETWILPHPRSQQEVTLHSHLTTISLPLNLDCVDADKWIAGDSPLCYFSSSHTWEAMRPRQEVQPWHDVVWFKGTIPKHGFNMWITNYDRLPTKNRLAAWGLPVSPTCPLCAREPETRDHLLLSCSYSLAVWAEVFIRCHPPASPFTDWSELLSWIRSPSSKRSVLLGR